MTKFNSVGFSSPEIYRDFTPTLKGDPDKFRERKIRLPLGAALSRVEMAWGKTDFPRNLVKTIFVMY